MLLKEIEGQLVSSKEKWSHHVKKTRIFTDLLKNRRATKAGPRTYTYKRIEASFTLAKQAIAQGNKLINLRLRTRIAKSKVFLSSGGTALTIAHSVDPEGQTMEIKNIIWAPMRGDLILDSVALIGVIAKVAKWPKPPPRRLQKSAEAVRGLDCDLVIFFLKQLFFSQSRKKLQDRKPDPRSTRH